MSALSADETQDRVAELLAKREGHFVFESGHHGPLWLDLELLFLRPERVQPLAEALAERLRPVEPETICGPLVGGAFVALMVASSLEVPFVYSEPTTTGESGDLFPVTYPIPAPLEAQVRGRRVTIVNDVISAGSAVRGTLASLVKCGARPVSIATLAVLGESASELAASHHLPLESLATFPASLWEPSACPLCAEGVPRTE